MKVFIKWLLMIWSENKNHLFSCILLKTNIELLEIRDSSNQGIFFFFRNLENKKTYGQLSP